MLTLDRVPDSTQVELSESDPLRHWAVENAIPFICAMLCGVCLLAFTPRIAAQNPPLVLLSETTSTRAIALESLTYTREPFPLDSLISWSPDRRTRVVLFALNLQLSNNEDPSSVITVDAEDFSHRHYDLKVEYAAPVIDNTWMTALTIRFSNELTDVGDVLIGIAYKGRTSNRVRIGVGHVGAGPSDDIDARPTSPFLVHGVVKVDNAPFASATMTLESNGSAVSTVTNDNGEYLIATVGGNYILSPAKAFYDFSPPNRVLTELSSAVDGVNFNGTRQLRSVAGVVRESNDAAIPNIDVTLTGPNTDARSARTDLNGRATFADVPAGFAYTITPNNTNIFTFTAQSIDSLAESTTLEFAGVRRQYSISGQLLDGTSGIANVTVKIKESGAMALTDSSGHYSFSGLTAGFDDTIMVTKEDYVFESPGVLISAIDSNHQVNIRGTPYVFLRGRIVDQNGQGLVGVKVEVSGTQSGTATTSADGRYSFLVTAFGNYVLRPRKEQDYYAYSPATFNLTGLNGSRNADFNATLISSVSPSYVLEFDGSPKTVDYSMPILAPLDYNLFFWNDGNPMGHFFWEFWAMPGANAGATYLISDGYGGAHAILFGVASFNSREPNRYQLLGNIWNGQFLTYFASDEGPAVNEWGHFAVGWDGTNIVTYLNGVPVGKTYWVGPRVTPGDTQGTGRLLIGGSDHSNFIGRIAQMRGYEDNNPLENAGALLATFAPQTVFTVDGNVMSYFFRPATNIADLSPFGLRGKQHAGLLRSTVNGVLNPCDDCPLPQFVIDPTAPDFAHPNNPGTPPTPVDTPAPVPGGALIFDSFSRRNLTYALNRLGGLDTTEGGTAGTRTWQTIQPAGQAQPFGILNGRAVSLANAKAIVWTNAPAGNTDLDIRVNRHAGLWGTGHNTGLSFRVVDSNNYFFAYTSDTEQSEQSQTLTVGYYSAGVRTELVSGISLPLNWTTLRVLTTSDGSISVYSGDEPLYSTSSMLLANSTGAGLYNNGPGLALTNRWDNFTVLSAP